MIRWKTRAEGALLFELSAVYSLEWTEGPAEDRSERELAAANTAPKMLDEDGGPRFLSVFRRIWKRALPLFGLGFLLARCGIAASSPGLGSN